MTATPDTSPENVARMLDGLRIKAAMISLGEKIAWGSDTQAMNEAADLAEALAAQLAARDETLDRMLAQVTALTADAEAARHAAARNFARAEAAEAKLAEVDAREERLKASFRVNMLRYGPPGTSHEEIDAAILAMIQEAPQ